MVKIDFPWLKGESSPFSPTFPLIKISPGNVDHRTTVRSISSHIKEVEQGAQLLVFLLLPDVLGTVSTETFAGVTVVSKIHDDRERVVSDSRSLFASLAARRGSISVRCVSTTKDIPSYLAISFASCATVR